MELVDGLNRALCYIEENLGGELSVEAVAREAGFSPFYFQRMFCAMTGSSLGEYIRRRRLSAAGQELLSGSISVLDAALKYGYDTPEGFAKAFSRFHGVTPSAAKRGGVPLRYLSPLKLSVSLKGGSVIDYTIERLPELFVMGRERRFSYSNSFETVPKFWDEYWSDGSDEAVPARIGVCHSDGEDGEDFAYLIGCFCAESDEPPRGFVRRPLGARLWAKFRARGEQPAAIQALNRAIYTEWLPQNPDYSPAVADMNVEVYLDDRCELWIPVEKIR